MTLTPEQKEDAAKALNNCQVFWDKDLVSKLQSELARVGLAIGPMDLSERMENIIHYCDIRSKLAANEELAHSCNRILELATQPIEKEKE